MTRDGHGRSQSTEEYLEALFKLALTEEGISVGRLASELQVAPSSVSQMLVRLVEEGLVARDEDGLPVWGQEIIIENGGHTVLYTDPKPGEHHGLNNQMTSTRNSYRAFVGGDLPSDRVTGMGLGLWLGGLDHTAFVLVFQRTTK